MFIGRPMPQGWAIRRPTLYRQQSFRDKSGSVAISIKQADFPARRPLRIEAGAVESRLLTARPSGL
jgi:hypothetical protein